MGGVDERSEPRARAGASRGRVAAVVIPAATALLIGGATLVVQRSGQEAVDEGVAQADARRLAVDVSFPGNDCAFEEAVGWDDPASAQSWTGLEQIPKAVAAGRAMGSFGNMRLHLTLPKTAELTSIDVRDVALVVMSKDDDKPPTWSIGPDGCGGGQYSRKYEVRLVGGHAQMLGAPDQNGANAQLFEPFSVETGETVHLDFEAYVCDPSTYRVQFAVSYKPDSSALKVLHVPAGGIALTALEASHRFMSTEGKLVALDPPQVPADLPFACGDS